jgi:hypothetical protein
MKTMLLSLIILPLTAFGAGALFTISGMHCGGCKKIVSKKVCDDVILSKQFQTCDIEVNTKKQIGTLKIEFKKESNADTKAIETAILAAGDEYKVTKTELIK